MGLTRSLTSVLDSPDGDIAVPAPSDFRLLDFLGRIGTSMSRSATCCVRIARGLTGTMGEGRPSEGGVGSFVGADMGSSSSAKGVVPLIGRLFSRSSALDGVPSGL